MEEKSKKTRGVTSVAIGALLILMGINGVGILFDSVASTWILSAILILTGLPSLTSKTYSAAVDLDSSQRDRMVALSRESEELTNKGSAVFFGSTIDPKVRESALAKYGKGFSREDEEILMLYDNTLRGSGKKGFFITNGYVYRRLDSNSNSLEQGRIPLREIGTLEITKTDRLVQKLLIDGNFSGNVGIGEEDGKNITDFFSRLKAIGDWEDS